MGAFIQWFRYCDESYVKKGNTRWKSCKAYRKKKTDNVKKNGDLYKNWYERRIAVKSKASCDKEGKIYTVTKAAQTRKEIW